MKRLILHFGVAVVGSMMLYCCAPVETPVFDETLLDGYWVTESMVTHKPDAEYWFYGADGSGYTWDTSEDVEEDEAQPFTWTLSEATLTQIHSGIMGEKVPKYYTVKLLTTSTMVYYDELSEKSYTFKKIVSPAVSE